MGGVQSQSITVDRQMRRYDVPRVAFVNKLDRAGADPWKVLRQMREKLRLNVAAVQVRAARGGTRVGELLGGCGGARQGCQKFEGKAFVNTQTGRIGGE